MRLMNPQQMKEAEHRLTFLQDRYAREKAARNTLAATATQEEYRTLHARWAAARRQGTLA